MASTTNDNANGGVVKRCIVHWHGPCPRNVEEDRSYGANNGTVGSQQKKDNRHQRDK